MALPNYLNFVSSEKVSELTSGTWMYRQNAEKTPVFAAFWSKTAGFARVLRSEKVHGGTFSEVTFEIIIDFLYSASLI